MNKKRKAVISVVSVVLIAALCITGYFAVKTRLWGVLNDATGQQQQTVSLYFLDNSKTKLVKEQRKLELASDNEGLHQLVELLIEGPKNNVDFKRALPEKTRLLSLTKHGNLVTADFSQDFFGASDADNMLAASTVVNTLCELEGIDKVTILVEGQELIGTDKKPLGALSKEDIIYDGSQTQQDSVVLSLYFPNQTGEYLQLEKRTVTLKDKEPLAKLTLTELMKGSEDNQAQRCIPAETKLLSVETKDKTCFVNFSRDFIDRHTGGSTAETMTIYSIINSLTEDGSIEKVQFLIEGQKVETFGGMVFNEPFERDESYIRQGPEASR